MPLNKLEIGWIGCELYFFDDGTFYGRVVKQGTEAEVDEWVRSASSILTASEIKLPNELMKRKIIDVYFQSVAISKTSKVFQVTHHHEPNQN